MYYLLMEEDNSIIPIRSEDIIDNLDSILEENTIFKVNSNLESISCVLQGTNGDRFNRVKVFSDYKIPTPLEIDTRNFYFHSNESVNYLSINRVFSKLFELQKTIYDSILSS